MSSAGGRTQIVDVTYDDPRTGERVRERKIQEVPYEQIEEIRGQELAVLRPNNARARADRRDERDYYGGRAYDDLYASRPRAGDRLAPPVDGRYDDRYADRRRESRRDEFRDRSRRRRDDHSDSDSESSRERRHRRRHRRAKSEQGAARDAEDKDSDSRLWYSGRPRKEGKWYERTFDSSYDGLIAAGAGAAIGGITARSFTNDENKRWKVAGGAIAGATAFNLAENKYRLYTEEKEEQREKREGNKKAEDVGMDQPLMLGGKMMAGGMMPGLK